MSLTASNIRNPLLTSVLRSSSQTLRFCPPILLASGVLGATLAMIERVARAGAGGIVTKSIGPEPRDGYGNPSVIGLGNGNILNAVGLSNPGVHYSSEDLSHYKVLEVPLIASVFGATSKEIFDVIRTLDMPTISAFEINLSCPHGGKYGAVLGSDPDTVTEIVRKAKSATKKPVWAKLSPNVTNLVDIALSAVEGGTDAIVVINTLKAMAIDVYMKRPVLSNVYGGLSGPAIRPVAIRCVYELYEAVEVPIVGVGGICSGLDVAEFLMAGATVVQVGSAILRESPEDLFPRLSRELLQFMTCEGFTAIEEVVGIAHSS